MADAVMGRGRGLLQALKRSQLGDSTPEGSLPGQSTAPSMAPSVPESTVGSTASSTSASTLGGRGKLVALMKRHQKPADPAFTPASDVSPSVPPPVDIGKGRGRGVKLLLGLDKIQKPGHSLGQGDAPSVASVTQSMAESTISSAVGTSMASTVGKNKNFREVKETPPVVMKGDHGVPVQVSANFVYLNFDEKFVFEYEVKYEPDQDYKNVRFKLLNEHIEYFKHKTFDGTTLYVPHMLPEEALNLVSTNPFDNSQVKIHIIFRRTRRMSEMVHIYNVLFKQIMKDLQLVRFGQQHFNEHAAIQIPQHKLEVWPGYVTAVDEYEGGLMLTLDSTHRVLRTQSVLEFVKQTIHSEGNNWKKALNEGLVGCSVMTTYNNKLFRVDSIDETMTPRSTFEKNDKGTIVNISYIDYYKKNYGIDIMDWDQPMLISRDSKRVSGSEQKTDFMICLVPELCQLTGLSDDQRSNFRLMKDVATYTRITPNQRHHAFKKYIENVLANETARNRLKGWGLSIAPETINLTARTLPPEPLIFGNNVKVNGKPNADWNGDIARQAVIQAVDLRQWAVLYTDRDKQVAKDFVDTLKRCCGPMGIQVLQPEMIRLVNDRTDSYIQSLRKVIATNPQIVVTICPNARDDRYAAIKRICCAEYPVPSQVINARTLMNQAKIRSITQKILLQMNCKLGGTLWGISIPVKKAMIVGIDAYHDAGRKKSSVLSFIASYDSTMTKWYSRVVFQGRGQEIVDSLKVCLVDSLQFYLRTNGCLPEKIIMYRDGVGDGQLITVRDYEIPQMQVCFALLDEHYQPKLTYVIVQKRINTRIFLRAGGGFENPAPGTVLDHSVTRRDWYDFLIVSQKVTQGTVTPTHYVVIYDDSGMPPDHLQRITYKMCHLYYNWPGTVRVPAPCQYAHKLSYLIGQCVNQVPADLLCDRLFFL